MTTAHRPTWAPAKGHEEQGGARYFGPSRQYSARDLASHTQLKERKDGQGSTRDLEQRDLKLELELKEKKHEKKRRQKEELADDTHYLEGAAPSGARKESAEQRLQPRAADADDEDDGGDDDDDDDDDEDDMAELLAEMERIKKERAEEAARKQAEQVKLEQAAKSAEVAKGNPLILKQDGSFNMKRRWDDDVVFKNQARNEPKEKKRFINDTIRSDFHRRFLNKYMK